VKVWIVIPAYNEERNIGRVIDSLRAEGWRNLLVVDDGSSDRTAEIARRKGAEVLVHPKNLGLGAALRSGFRRALELGADAVVTFDADGQHDAKDVRKLVEALGEADAVIGVRKSLGIPLHKKFGNFALNVLTFMLTGIYTDSQSGSRALSRRALQKLVIKGNRYEVSSEIILRVSQMGLKWKEVPVTCYYPPHAKVKGTTILSGIRIFLKLLSLKLAK
jgi:glycosyltransferase involved in cell wall biosynthesis